MKKLAILTLALWCLTARAETSLVQSAKNSAGKNVLADTFHRTLYIFDVDKNGVSACSGSCAEIWPPYIVSGTEAKSLKAPLGTTKRASNQLQLTLNGQPLYTYMLDRKAGDDFGDGIGEVWHIVEVAE